MKKNYRSLIKTPVVSFILLVLLIVNTSTALGHGAQASFHASGMPNSAVFGFGIGVNETAANLNDAVRVAKQTGFDWLALEVNWAQLQPTAEREIDLRWLKNTVSLSGQYQVNLLVSISNPPAWALTSEGPSADLTAHLVSQIAQAAPETVLAVELIPGANIATNWGAPANPAGYANLLKNAESALIRVNPSGLILPSIAPLGANQNTGDMNDLEFLSGLYNANGGSFPMPIIGLNYSHAGLAGEPVTNPSDNPDYSLRHYEQVRDVMESNNRRNDLIWITSFSWPAALSDKQVQASWVTAAYKQLQGQLFIGAAFFTRLNAQNYQDQAPSLVGSDLIQHPALAMLSGLIREQNSASGIAHISDNGPAGSKGTFLENLISAIFSWFGVEP